MWNEMNRGHKKRQLGKCLAVFCLTAYALLCPATPAKTAETAPDEGLLYRLMSTQPEQFGQILAQPDTYEVQLLLTVINRDAHNIPTFTGYSFNLDAKRYFYPASTVKLPVVALALQKLYQLDEPLLNRDCQLVRSGRQSGITVAEHIKRIFYYSDNDSYHYLYNLLGVDYLNDTLHGMGYEDSLIFRKFTITSARQDANTPAMYLYSEGQKLYEQPPQTVREPYSLADRGLGNVVRGYRSYKNFDNWNYVSVENLQLMLQAIVLPQTVEAHYRFDISSEDYLFLLDCLRGEGDISHKYFISGGSQPLPKGVEIYNKTGTGYGNIVDNAYIVDREYGLEFLLTAVIYVNPNGIMGDDIYAYESVGKPFLRDIGSAVYNYLLKQKEAANDV